MGAWVWILIIVFLLFRFLLLARKETGKEKPDRSAGKGMEPPFPPHPAHRGDDYQVGPEREGGRRRDMSDLADFLEALSGVPSPRPLHPPPTKLRAEKIVRPPPPPPPPSRPSVPPPAPEAAAETEDFDLPPLVRGIVWSEILGPPMAFRPDSKPGAGG